MILGSEGALNGPVPALLMAATRNSYSLPSIRSFTVNVVSLTESLTAFVHLLEEVSFFSMMYPVTGLPPSDSGGDQEMVIWVLSTPVTSGFSGAPGTSVYNRR